MPTRATTASASPLLHVRVQPRARRNEVVGWQGDVLRVRVTAAPADGAANRAVTDLLAEVLGVAASRIALVRGAASRDKLFRVERLLAPVAGLVGGRHRDPSLGRPAAEPVA